MKNLRFTKPEEGKSICSMVDLGHEYYARGGRGEGTLVRLPDGQYMVTYRLRRYVPWEHRSRLGYEKVSYFSRYWGAIGFLNRTIYAIKRSAVSS